MNQSSPRAISSINAVPITCKFYHGVASSCNRNALLKLRCYLRKLQHPTSHIAYSKKSCKSFLTGAFSPSQNVILAVHIRGYGLPMRILDCMRISHWMQWFILSPAAQPLFTLYFRSLMVYLLFVVWIKKNPFALSCIEVSRYSGDIVMISSTIRSQRIFSFKIF